MGRDEMEPNNQIKPTESSRYTRDLPEDSSKLFMLDEFAVLDMKEGLKTIGSEASLRELLKMMVKEALPQDLAKMEAAYAAKDWDKVQQLAHKIKGGAVYVGTVKMKMACQYLERSWKVGKKEHLEQLYQQVLMVIHETMEGVSKFLSGS